MAKKLTTEEFVTKARSVHGDRYDYSRVRYLNSHTKVDILCKDHGVFSQTPDSHLNGRGCKMCKSETLRKKFSRSLEDFIAQAQAVHGDSVYDYREVMYKNHTTNVRIICPTHGVFEQRPAVHLRGRGCPACGRKKSEGGRRSTLEDFIRAAGNIHAGKYNYTQARYVNNKTKLTIICPKHGEFQQSPDSHLRGKGCTTCGQEATKAALTVSTAEFVKRATEIHEGFYIYTHTVYRGVRTPVSITCPIHGVFKQLPTSHLAGGYCRRCANYKTLSQDTIVRRLGSLYGDEYGYSKIKYSGMREPVVLVCREHGEFSRRPDTLLHGGGCPKCNAKTSIGERSLRTFIESLVPPGYVEAQERIDYGPRRMYLDVAVPSLGLGIEFNGLYWHSEETGKTATYHREKSQIGLHNGYKDIVHIFEDDWLHRRWAVEHLLRYKLCELPSLMARKLTVGNVEHKAARSFYTSYHMQGPSIAAGQVHYGLYQQDELVAVMSFTQHSSGRRKLEAGHWELVRFASKYRVQGGASKLFKAFTKEHSPQSVLSFSWSHLFNGNVYQVLGFKLDKELPPDYMYVDKKQCRRLHKAGFQHSKMRLKFGEGYDPTLTEKQNCANNGYYRIFDCGKKRWVWTP